MRLKILLLTSFFVLPSAFAQVIVPMTAVNSDHGDKVIGRIIAEDTDYGLLLIPELTHLKPGFHGFHLHAKPSCDDHGTEAGGHYDPENTNKHLGPFNRQGHRGDLPVLYVDETGKAQQPTLAPRLREADLKGRAFIIHEHGDNYLDTPKPLGGGGDRVACGVVPYQTTIN